MILGSEFDVDLVFEPHNEQDATYSVSLNTEKSLLFHKSLFLGKYHIPVSHSTSFCAFIIVFIYLCMNYKMYHLFTLKVFDSCSVKCGLNATA